MDYLEVLFDERMLKELEEVFEEGVRLWGEQLEIDPFINNKWFEDEGRDIVLSLYPNMDKKLLKCIERDLEGRFI